MIWQAPYREIGLIRNNNRNYWFSFEDVSTPVIPAINPGVSNHSLYDFPDGTIFKFRAKDDLFDIQKTGTWNDLTKEIRISFVPLDTVNITKDRRIYFEMDAIFPLPLNAPVGTPNDRYTILVGHVVIFATKNLNA